jgi:hypothetical protein
MTANKDLKRLVRARMKKTGEAYTAARAQITSKSRTKSTAAAKVDYAALAGMSDAVIKEKTGCSWERWVKSLDYQGAADMSHPEIARVVRDKYKVGDWWTQAVTVGYERIKGLRAKGQRRDGNYEVNKSRTLPVPVRRLFDASHDATLRRKWLETPGVRIRTATSPKSIRLGWPDGSIVVLGFTAKPNDRSMISIQHTKLPDKAAADSLKTFWSEKLDSLGEILSRP